MARKKDGHPEVSDAVVERARSGDVRAHSEIFRTFSGQVFSTARRMLGRHDLAEEVVQDVFVDVIRKIDAFRGDAPLGAWIHRIAVNRSLMMLRSAWHRQGSSLDEDDWRDTPDLRAPGDTVAATSRIGMDLEGALDQLGDTARAVVWLYDVEGRTHQEIAEMMGKTVSFSKSQLSRAHARLREMLGSYDEVEGCDTRASTNC